MQRPLLNTTITSIALLASLLFTPVASAHWFGLWCEIDEDGAHVYYSGSFDPGSPKLLTRAKNAKFWHRNLKGEVSELTLTQKEDEFFAPLEVEETVALEGLLLRTGTGRRSKVVSLSVSGAKFLKVDSAKNLTTIGPSAKLDFDLYPVKTEAGYSIKVLFQGKPVADARVTYQDAQYETHRLTTDSNGLAAVKLDGDDLVTFVAHHKTDKGGEHEGTKFETTSYATTLVLTFPQE
ncbi:MAG: DUF4198 domain-containing protein [Pirellulaceae bacterium]|nr:DUF4198 domain-containing protein [Pirellulaceae bacterium]